MRVVSLRHYRRAPDPGSGSIWQGRRDSIALTSHGNFVRQAPVGPYIADFLCRENKLIVEVDGATHSTDAEVANDSNRSRHLAALGYRVIRFHNDEIVNGLDEVLTLIAEALPSRA